MQKKIGRVEPVLELKGFANRIDLSAWISGLSFSLGFALCDLHSVADECLNGRLGLYVLIAAYTAFLASVLIIQRHMHLSLLANTFCTPRQLVTNGPFRYTRNPIYVAFFLPLASISYFSLPAAIVATGFYVLAMNLTVIRKEERDLLAAFGNEYISQLAATPRWII